ncbi:hypothetical protein IFO70_04450 [Phormidium tenue FACHB-886]|nr:hypothetical protein [Phormidium tenue FACHB-886]
MISQPVQLDPLGSPHPVPWGWVASMLSEGQSSATPRVRYYRSPSLVSPDGLYAAYSRMQMQLSTDFTRSRITSILLLENLQTGDLQTILACSPFADNPFSEASLSDWSGTIAMLVPVAWSETGDRLLIREFESLFGSSLATDFAVIWERSSNTTHTVAPTQLNYTNAILLGWSQAHPDRALFRAGIMGEENWSLYTVDKSSKTVRAADDRPLTFGRVVNSVWAGPQSAGR